MKLKQKLYDLKNQKQQAIERAKEFALAGALDGEAYKEQKALIDKLNPQIAEVEALLAEEEKSFAPGGEADLHGFAPGGGEEKVFASGTLKGLKDSTVKSFATDVRKAMTEGTGADGGYTVPEDVVNRIYELIEAKDNILPYITNTRVATKFGKRTYKKRSQMTGFQTVAEAAKFPAAEQPTFAQLSYEIVKRGGYLPVTNELLEDSDENIAALVIEWLADEARVTINKKAVETATGGAPKDLDGLDGILEVLTVGLGSALRAISTIHTNDSGLLWLLTRRDANGRSLLNPDPTQPTRMLLSVGAVTVPIKTWDNATLPNTEAGGIPFLIGSLQEGVQRFDRRDITITRLTEATVGNLNLAEQDMTAFKASMRDDYVLRDGDAFVYAVVSGEDADAGGAAKLTGIEITKAPNKIDYAGGESFVKTGMTVKAKYDDGTEKAVSSAVTIIGGENLTAGTTSVTVAYAEGGRIVTARQAIAVS